MLYRYRPLPCASLCQLRRFLLFNAKSDARFTGNTPSESSLAWLTRLTGAYLFTKLCTRKQY